MICYYGPYFGKLGRFELKCSLLSRSQNNKQNVHILKFKIGKKKLTDLFI